jgi:hypothetical protein
MIRKLVAAILVLFAVLIAAGAGWSRIYGLPIRLGDDLFEQNACGPNVLFQLDHENCEFRRCIGQTPVPSRDLSLPGITLESFTCSGGDGHYVFAAPSWLMVLVLAVYPFVTFLFGPLRRAFRRLQGRCAVCGYNLTGNISGTCPECGERIEEEEETQCDVHP